VKKHREPGWLSDNDCKYYQQGLKSYFVDKHECKHYNALTEYFQPISVEQISFGTVTEFSVWIADTKQILFWKLSTKSIQYEQIRVFGQVRF
jgi:hypothetical protein